MEQLIRAVLSERIGEEQAQQVDIVANAVELDNKPNWTIRYRHPERFDLGILLCSSNLCAMYYQIVLMGTTNRG
jgi:2-hydroxy-3-keto-5-methylthiopentenyl-1-phosphate phosphatase